MGGQWRVQILRFNRLSVYLQLLLTHNSLASLTRCFFFIMAYDRCLLRLQTNLAHDSL